MTNSVVEIVATISKREPSEIKPEMDLRSLGFSNSIGLLRLQSTLERKFGTKLRLTDQTTIHALLEKLQPGQANGFSTTDAAEALDEAPGFSVGVDLEEVANLPVTDRYKD